MTKKKISSFLDKKSVLLLISFIVAIVLWFVITIDNTSEYTNRMTIPVTINNEAWEGTYADQIGLKLADTVKENVTVTVDGPWSVVGDLTKEDIIVEPDYSTIQKAGKQEVALVASFIKPVSGGRISCTPATITFECDYWKTITVPFAIEAPAVTVVGDEDIQLGTPVPEMTISKDNTVEISGPQTIVSKIEKLVAVVSDKMVLSETKRFDAMVKAVDKNNAEVVMDHCEIPALESMVVPVVMPVEKLMTLKLNCTMVNLPKGFPDDKISITPSSLQIRGPIEVMKDMTESYEIGQINMDNLEAGKITTKEFNLKLGNSVVVETQETKATVQVDLSAYTTKTIPLRLTSKNVQVTGSGSNTVTVQDRSISVTLCGTNAALKDITDEDLLVEVVLGRNGNTLKNGSSTYTGRVKVNASGLAWVYYGETETGIPVYLKVS